MILKYRSLQRLKPLSAFMFMLLFVSVSTVGAFPERPDGITPPSVLSARIVLQAPTFEADDWTVVQWRAADGNWYDVTGWQGNFHADGTVLWWVGIDQLGQQNFRWVVYDDVQKSTVLSSSETFNLPSAHNGIVTVAP